MSKNTESPGRTWMLFSIATKKETLPPWKEVIAISKKPFSVKLSCLLFWRPTFFLSMVQRYF